MTDTQELQKAYSLLHTKDGYKEGLNIICKIADKNPCDIITRQLLYDCFVVSRIYGYIDIANKHRDGFLNGLHTSESDFLPILVYGSTFTENILTKDQKIAFDTFQEKRKVCISAPTSFGKTFLLFEILAANKDYYNNILIIVPTIALSTEIYFKLKTNTYLKDFELINNTRIPFDPDKKHIFLFTPEKTDIFLDEHPEVIIDFFAMDEIYKIKFDEERKDYFDYCLYKLLNKKNSDVYLIGPYIEDFDIKLREKYGIEFLKFTNELVGKNLEKVKKGSKEHRLLEIITNRPGEQFIIYHGYQKGNNENTALYLSDKLDFTGPTDLADFLEKNYHKEWGLIKCLRKGIAFHHGSIPRYIQKEIMDRFNKGEIKVLVATSTIIEGVNTTAKNVILYDDKKANKQISKFDKKNIVGRAGRFGEHFVGYCFDLNKVDITEDLGEDHVTSEYSDIENIGKDKLLLVEPEDITKEGVNGKVEKLVDDCTDIFPGFADVLKRNKFVDIEKQISLLKSIVSNIDSGRIIEFTGFQGEWQEMFKKIYEMIENSKLFPEDNRGGYKYPSFVYAPWIISYIFDGEKEFLQKYIKHKVTKGGTVNTAIREGFSIISSLFGFLLPKYLKVFENIYNLVASNRGVALIEMDFLISKIEFGYHEEHQMLLSSLGIPYMILDKIEHYFQGVETLDDIEKIYKTLHLNFLTEFEKNILGKLILGKEGKF